MKLSQWYLQHACVHINISLNCAVTSFSDMFQQLLVLIWRGKMWEWTSLVVYWSEFLTTDYEVPGSVPGSTVGIFP
jgi:hypothetical protein